MSDNNSHDAPPVSAPPAGAPPAGAPPAGIPLAGTPFAGTPSAGTPPVSTPGPPPSYRTNDPQSPEDTPAANNAPSIDPLTGQPCTPPPAFDTVPAGPPRWCPRRIPPEPLLNRLIHPRIRRVVGRGRSSSARPAATPAVANTNTAEESSQSTGSAGSGYFAGIPLREDASTSEDIDREVANTGKEAKKRKRDRVKRVVTDFLNKFSPRRKKDKDDDESGVAFQPSTQAPIIPATGQTRV